MVIIEKYYVLKAAEVLGLKLSTAKYIIRCYRRRGKILKKYDKEDITQEEIEWKMNDLREREKHVKKLNKR